MRTARWCLATIIICTVAWFIGIALAANVGWDGNPTPQNYAIKAEDGLGKPLPCIVTASQTSDTTEQLFQRHNDNAGVIQGWLPPGLYLLQFTCFNVDSTHRYNDTLWLQVQWWGQADGRHQNQPWFSAKHYVVRYQNSCSDCIDAPS